MAQQCRVAQGKQIAEEPTPAAKQFVEAFTKHYAAIAAGNPLYADLRNLFDWVAVCRLIKLLDVPRRIQWDFSVLRQGVPIRELPVPATMPGVIAVRHAEVKTGQGTAAVTFPARGGVSIDVTDSVQLERSRLDASLGLRLSDVLSVRPRRPGEWWR